MRKRRHGRAAELEAMSVGLDEVSRGHARAFALVGEPGIGKTRLAAEVAQRAAAFGFAPCWGRSWEAGGAPPYWPWRLLLESIPHLPPRRGALSLLWGSQVAPSVAAAHPGQARFELFDAVASAIPQASAHQPLPCVLHDLPAP